MKFPTILVSLALALGIVPTAQGQEFTGGYVLPVPNGAMTLQLQEDAHGRVTGTMTGNGTTFSLDGRVEDEVVVGTVHTPVGLIAFAAELTTGGIEILLANIVNGEPDYETAQELFFQRAESPRGGATSPTTTGSSVTSALGRQWDVWLRGRKVTYIDSYSSGSSGGYSNKTIVHLCRNGQFLYRESNTVTVDVPGAFGSGGGQDGGQGTWQIVTQGAAAGMQLRFLDGRVMLFRLERQGEATYVDGDRVYVTPGELC